jgi:hypothetical protein
MRPCGMQCLFDQRDLLLSALRGAVSVGWVRSAPKMCIMSDAPMMHGAIEFDKRQKLWAATGQEHEQRIEKHNKQHHIRRNYTLETSPWL